MVQTQYANVREMTAYTHSLPCVDMPCTSATMERPASAGGSNVLRVKRELSQESQEFNRMEQVASSSMLTGTPADRAPPPKALRQAAAEQRAAEAYLSTARPWQASAFPNTATNVARPTSAMAQALQPAYQVNTQFKINVTPESFTEHREICLAGYATGPGKHDGTFFDNPIDLRPPCGLPATLTPMVPATMAVDDKGYAIANHWFVRLIFKIVAADFETWVKAKLTIATAPGQGIGVANITGVAIKPATRTAHPIPVLRFASDPTNIVPNTPITLNLSMTAISPARAVMLR
jgi:hypothetical protein